MITDIFFSRLNNRWTQQSLQHIVNWYIGPLVPILAPDPWGFAERGVLGGNLVSEATRPKHNNNMSYNNTRLMGYCTTIPLYVILYHYRMCENLLLPEVLVCYDTVTIKRNISFKFSLQHPPFDHKCEFLWLFSLHE